MKRIVCGMLVVALLILGLAASGEARSRGHFHSGVRIGIGVPFLWGGPWGYPGWGPYPYSYYSPPPVVIERQAPVYVQPEQQYWYYCQEPQGYYPYIQRCPGGWLQVVPSAPPAP